MSAKYQQLAGILRSELQQLARQGGTRLASEAELCRRYHMSRQTVRHALKLLEEEGLIQRRRGSGTYAAQAAEAPQLRRVALVVSSPDSYLYPSLLHDLQSVLPLRGYTAEVFTTEDRVSREREILCRLLDGAFSAAAIEGVQTAFPSPNGDLYRRIRERGIPLLFLHGCSPSVTGFPCLWADDQGGGSQLAKYLLSRGHRRVAGIFRYDDIRGPRRWSGLVRGLREGGAEPEEERFAWYAACDGREKRALVEDFLRTRLGDATAVVCQNDELAHLLILALREQGRQIPGEVAVVSFDNSYLSQIGPVPITSLGHRSQRAGRAAAQMLEALLEGSVPDSRTLDWHIFQRSSG